MNIKLRFPASAGMTHTGRHPGESRGPEVLQPSRFLDTGFRRYDVHKYLAVCPVFVVMTALKFIIAGAIFQAGQIRQPAQSLNPMYSLTAAGVMHPVGRAAGIMAVFSKRI
jgi:hypothetical protein